VSEVQSTAIPASADALEMQRLRAQLDAMEQLLEVHEETVFAQSRKLEEAYRELDSRAQELSRSNRELETFAYVASHDLQEPLRMVASYTQLLERRYGAQLDDTAREFMAYAVDGANRMQALIRALLEYSRVGTRAGLFTPVPLDEVMDAVRRDLTVAIAEKGAVVTNDPLPVVIADRTQMSQLLLNLVGNGLKFTGGRAPRVHVSGRTLPDAWEVSVRDEGIGIEPRYFQRIFQIFQRLHGPAEYQGTGIGLAVCRRIAERHGGSIDVQSTPGAGSTFTFTIRKREPDE
jgi:two-component system, chemotaxis family, sensor kinase Cph1